jgi:hypothetical protein
VGDFRSDSSCRAECISNCTACESICLETLAHCQARGGAYASEQLTSLLAVCAEICALSVRTMKRGSEAHVFICAACAQVNQRCAQACSAFPDDPLMHACAAACSMCSRCCGEMGSTSMPVAGHLRRHAS